eukprot:CAMPEP_0206258452 /NCGR_PEP_ID=MMETSP0047_2-20121206/25928_1 /ASSEMBLY_ACC=CAM_ASM_000192 /TAXON_ID=195065 /ORGANISM="Chroomonas mesostigmatica_cf, Strain CCMP1168" /LENGTH=187 /DNA_ID=CAMNT_0053685199 /DNA_START=126 /DNA_END=685 /DNA_ORIENTATION=+
MPPAPGGAGGMVRRQTDPRMRFLASVGVAAARPLTVAEEEELLERQKHLQQLQAILGRDDVDIEGLRSAMVLGGMNEAATRMLAWQLALEVQPACMELGEFNAGHRRRWYHDIRRVSQCLSPTPSVLGSTHLHLSGSDDQKVLRGYMQVSAQLVQDWKTHHLSTDAHSRDRGRALDAAEREFDLKAV